MSIQQKFTLAHLSDIHLDPMPKPRLRELAGKRMIGHFNWHRSRKSIHPRQVLDKLVHDLKDQNPDHIAVTGDVVNIGLPEEFENAQKWLEQLGDGENVSVVPGNHDAYVKMAHHSGFWRWQNFMRSSDTALSYLPEDFKETHHDSFPFLRLFGKVAVIGLSSAIPTAPFIAAGRLGSEQSQTLKHVLQKLGKDGFYRVVMLHHPPFHEAGQWMHGLRDARHLMAILHETSAELVLHGHTHNHLVRKLPSLNGDIPVIGVPSASQYNHKRKPSARYNLYHITPTHHGWKMQMDSHGVTDVSSAIVPLDSHEFLSKH